jgi:predicted dehydrogenase
MPKTMRFAAVGAGFWGRYQLCAWKEIPDVVCAAICDQNRTRAEALANELGITAAYDDVEEMLRVERPDFLDVISTEESHSTLVHLAIQQGVPVICQKPMAPTRSLAVGMVSAARAANVPFLVHENFRFQAPLRAAKRVLIEGCIGTPLRARLEMVSGFSPFKNQPNLKELERFILTDLGSHILDLARFYFGEAEQLFCTTRRVHPDIRGEDMATVMLKMQSGVTVLCLMGLAGTPLEREAFPETLLFVEGSEGSLEVAPGHSVRVTTREGTVATRHVPSRYPWCHPNYLVAQASMVPCNENLLFGISGSGPAETTGEDNLKTMELVFSSYDSASKSESVLVES